MLTLHRDSTEHEMDPWSLTWFSVVAILKICCCPAATREKSRSLFTSKRRKKTLEQTIDSVYCQQSPVTSLMIPNYSSAVLYFFLFQGQKVREIRKADSQTIALSPDWSTLAEHRLICMTQERRHVSRLPGEFATE